MLADLISGLSLIYLATVWAIGLLVALTSEAWARRRDVVAVYLIRVAVFVPLIGSAAIALGSVWTP